MLALIILPSVAATSITDIRFCGFSEGVECVEGKPLVLFLRHHHLCSRGQDILTLLTQSGARIHERRSSSASPPCAETAHGICTNWIYAIFVGAC